MTLHIFKTPFLINFHYFFSFKRKKTGFDRYNQILSFIYNMSTFLGTHCNANFKLSNRYFILKISPIFHKLKILQCPCKYSYFIDSFLCIPTTVSTWWFMCKYIIKKIAVTAVFKYEYYSIN